MRKRAVFKNGDCNILQSRISKRRLRYLQDIFTTLVDSQWRWTLSIFAIGFVGNHIPHIYNPKEKQFFFFISRFVVNVRTNLVAHSVHPRRSRRRSPAKQPSRLRMDAVRTQHPRVHVLLPVFHRNPTHYRIWCANND